MKILHLYHDIMNLYGEYANVSALERMLEKSGVKFTTDRLTSLTMPTWAITILSTSVRVQKKIRSLFCRILKSTRIFLLNTSTAAR